MELPIVNVSQTILCDTLTNVFSREENNMHCDDENLTLFKTNDTKNVIIYMSRGKSAGH